MSSATALSTYTTCDANEAVASVAYRLNELIAIYPITPSSTMAEVCDEWAAAGKPNLWGQVPRVVQLQSEGGVAGAVHGGLLGGALTTTFTASQGLLLMIPNLYKIAGELLPFTMHVSARALAAQGLSIFGDHQDVMACRATGCALLCSNSGQEAHDLALIATVAGYRARVPFIHFFDEFRTSREVSKLALLTDEQIAAVSVEADIAAFRARAMSPGATPKRLGAIPDQLTVAGFIHDQPPSCARRADERLRRHFHRLNWSQKFSHETFFPRARSVSGPLAPRGGTRDARRAPRRSKRQRRQRLKWHGRPAHRIGNGRARRPRHPIGERNDFTPSEPNFP
jgi:pyruvate/2-oxoacid:ferredoxin oxidoreductase alpha subunit